MAPSVLSAIFASAGVVLSAVVSGGISWKIATKQAASQCQQFREKILHEDQVRHEEYRRKDEETRQQWAHELEEHLAQRTEAKTDLFASNMSAAMEAVSQYLNQTNNLPLRMAASKAVSAAVTSAPAEKKSALAQLCNALEQGDVEGVRRLRNEVQSLA